MAHFATVEKYFAVKDELSNVAAKLAEKEAKIVELEDALAVTKQALDVAAKRACELEIKSTGLEKTIAEPSADIQRLANLKALEIASSQGIVPVKTEAQSVIAAGDLMAELNAIKDPALRTQFFRDNRKRFDSASLRERAKSNGSNN